MRAATSPLPRAALQKKWEETSDQEKPAAIALVVGAVVAQIAIGATVDAVDKLPFLSDVFELLGFAVIGVYGWKLATEPAERCVAVRAVLALGAWGGLHSCPNHRAGVGGQVAALRQGCPETRGCTCRRVNTSHGARACARRGRSRCQLLVVWLSVGCPKCRVACVPAGSARKY